MKTKPHKSLPLDDSQTLPTKAEAAAAQRVLDRRRAQAPAPKFNVTRKRQMSSISPDHPLPAVSSSLLLDMLGTGNTIFADSLLYQMANLSAAGADVTANELNEIVAIVHAIAPKDPTEALLALQMTAIHKATIKAARQLSHAKFRDQQDSCSNMLNKLARTFAAQVETLKRYRSTGAQNVHVTHQHVNVAANQAVVGINTRGGGFNENASQSHAPSETGEPGPALLGHEQAVPVPVQSPSSEGKEGVPNARSPGGGTQRQS